MTNMNELIKYDEAYNIIVGDGTFTKYGFPKNGQKTVTISKGQFKASIKVEDIKIHPNTYWGINGYDAQFEGRDANCWLCGWYGMDYGKCKCKKHFTLEEHVNNVKISRRNYLKTLFKNYFEDKVKIVSNLSDVEIDDLLFDDSTGIRNVKLYFPHWSNREEEIKKMTEYLSKKGI